jgi:hypothetical protein
MSQTKTSDQAVQEAATREIQGILAALDNRRASTDVEVEQALRMLKHNPKTITVGGLCTCIYNNFYKEQTDILRRNPSGDCFRSTVFGQACVYLGLITDAETQDYLWSRSGTMTSVNYQPVLLREIVAYLNKRDAGREARRAIQAANVASKQERSCRAALAKKQSLAESAAFADACVADEEGATFVENADDYAYEHRIDRIVAKYEIKGGNMLTCLLNLMALPDSHPAKRELFSSD